MALIHCPECRITVSDQAPTCPGCGYPINVKNDPAVSYMEEKRQKQQTVGVISLVVMLLVFLISMLITFAMLSNSTPTITACIDNAMGTPINVMSTPGGTPTPCS